MNERFLLAYILPKNSADTVAAISTKLSAEIGIADPHRRIPPHQTLKSPFTADRNQLAGLKEKLSTFAGKQQSGTIIIDGFSHFNKRVVYCNGQADEVARGTIDALSN